MPQADSVKMGEHSRKLSGKRRRGGEQPRVEPGPLKMIENYIVCLKDVCILLKISMCLNDVCVLFMEFCVLDASLRLFR